MSSLKQLNRSIKLKRLEGSDAARRCQLSLNIFLYSVHKQTKAHPWIAPIGAFFSVFIFSKYTRKIRTFYPLASLGANVFKQYQDTKK